MKRSQIIEHGLLVSASTCVLAIVGCALAFLWRWIRRAMLWTSGLVLGVLGFGSAVQLVGADSLSSAAGALPGLVVAGLALWLVAFGNVYQVNLRDGRQILVISKKRHRC
jgi:hypothetical protein